jgi:hypothetical protein
MTIIALNGLSGAGKDTLATALRPEGYTHGKFAYGLRAVVYTQRGMNHTVDKTKEHELGIQDDLIKTSATILRYYPLLWCDVLDWVMYAFPSNNWVISDLRQPHEYTWCLKRDASIFKVQREGNTAKVQPLDNLLDGYYIPLWEGDLPPEHPTRTHITFSMDNLINKIELLGLKWPTISTFVENYHKELNSQPSK